MVPVPKFPIAVAPPGPHRAIRTKRVPALVARSHSRHVREPAHLNRDVAARSRPVSQLANRVVAPGPDRPVGAQGIRGVVASSERSDSREPAHLNWDAAVVCRPISQLALRVLAPGPDGAIREQRVRGGTSPTRDRGHTTETADRNWDRSCRSGTEVRAPSPHRPHTEGAHGSCDTGCRRRAADSAPHHAPASGLWGQATHSGTVSYTHLTLPT